jgi:hypothetical protein
MSEKPMVNHAENGAAVALGSAVAAFLAQQLAYFSIIPEWLGRTVLTIVVSALAFTVNYYLKIFFDNRRAKREEPPADKDGAA